MTQIFLNHVKVDFEIEGDDTDVGSCIKAFEDELNSCAHIITSICVDGEEVTDWREKPFQSKLLVEVNELKILASTREELVLVGFGSCLQLIHFICSDLNLALNRYRDEEYGEATEALSRALNSSHDLMKTYDAISVNIRLSVTPPGFTGLVESLETLVGIFEDTKAALDSGDVIAITDLIEYEAIPLVELVGEELTLLSNKGDSLKD